MDNSEISAAAQARLNALQHIGSLSDADATALGCRLIETEHGAAGSDDNIFLSLAVDATGVIRAVKLRSLASGLHLLAFDIMAEKCLGSPIDLAAQLTPAMIDDALKTLGAPAPVHKADPSQPYYILVKAAKRWHGDAHVPPPPGPAGLKTAAELPWTEVGLFEKVRRIEGVLDANVRPALASDGGGLDLVDLRDPELIVQYHGACGSCSSSIGGTLAFIQDTLNQNLNTELKIVVQGTEEETPFWEN